MVLTSTFANEYTSLKFGLAGRLTGTMGKTKDQPQSASSVWAPAIATIMAIVTVVSGSTYYLSGRIDRTEAGVASLRASVKLDSAKLNQEVIPRLNKLYDGKNVPGILPTPEVAELKKEQEAIGQRIQILEATAGHADSALLKDLASLKQDQRRIDASIKVSQAATIAVDPVRSEWDRALLETLLPNAKQQNWGYVYIPKGVILRNRPALYTTVSDNQVSLEGYVPSDTAKTAVTEAIRKAAPDKAIINEKLKTEP